MDADKKVKRVKLVLYRFAGRFWFWRIRKTCRECDLAYVLLQRLMAETFRGEPVDLEIKPWLDNWWKVIGRGGWHTPILTVNGRVFSQGEAPDLAGLIQKVASLLGNEQLMKKGAKLSAKRASAPQSSSLPTVYFSPACPHCHRLRSYLDANAIEYVVKDVTESEAAREDVRRLTGRNAIPVLKVDGEILVGFEVGQLQNLLAINPKEDQWESGTVRQRRSGMDPARLAEVVHEAKRVLESNWRGDRTIPSEDLYPHQWNWDSGFAARGYLHFRLERAYTELRSLFEGQWRDGFLPHMIFSQDKLDHFPGPDYWHSEYSEQAPEGVLTSGISQPPVHASMVADATQLDPDSDRARGFLEEIYPKLRKLHEFYFDNRDPSGEGLISLVHPWESGLDNTPLWDKPLSRIRSISPWALQMQERFNTLAEEGKRPKRPYIGVYSHLIENLQRHKYDWQAIGRNHEFMVQDVLFNAILCKAERDLGEIAEAVGEDPKIHAVRSDRLGQAMNRKLWDEEAGLYYDFDLVAQEPIRSDTVFSYLPLYGKICDPERAARVIESLRTHCFCVSDRNCVGIPSYDMCQVDYQGEYYWRGPVWVNINWCLAAGLREYGEEELADWIETSLLNLVSEHGFYEYYEPETGKGLGASNFSWTAALIIDIAGRLNHDVETR